MTDKTEQFKECKHIYDSSGVVSDSNFCIKCGSPRKATDYRTEQAKIDELEEAAKPQHGRHKEKKMITIRAVSNGFIMSYPDLEMEEGSCKNNTVEEVFIVSGGDNGEEFFAMRDLFCSIMIQLGIYTSKHNQYNIRIDVVDKEGKVVYQDWKIRKSD